MAKSDGMNPLPSLIRAAAWDAGDRSMRTGGRKAWSRKDYNAAADAQTKFTRACYTLPTDTDERMCFVRFAVARELEERRLFTLTSDFDEILRQIDGHIGLPMAA